MKIVKGKDRPTRPGNPHRFTGEVRVEPLVEAPIRREWRRVT